MDMDVKDAAGRSLQVDDFTMDGDLSNNHFFDDQSRDFDGFSGSV